MKKPKVLILGAGFGGLTAAKCLPADFEVTLVDRHNFQTFLPLLYQVSTVVFVALFESGADSPIAALISGLLIVLLRLLSVMLKINLPKVK